MKDRVLIFLLGALLVILVIQGSVYLSGSHNIVSTVTKSDAIVLLSGSYKERAPAAAMLMRNGYADRIILTNDGVFSSWSIKHNRNLYQIEWAEEELVSCGVPREKIVKLPEFVNSTMSEAVVASRYIRLQGLKKIILVTSDYHSRRTFWAFNKSFDNYPVELMVFPTLSPAAGVKTKFSELIKLTYYQVRYGLAGMMSK